MQVLDTVLVLTSILWMGGKWKYSFFAAPGDSLRLYINSDGLLDAVYFGEFGKTPTLSEAYTDSLTWIYISDTIKPYTLQVEKGGFYSKVRVRIRIERHPMEGWKKFETTLKVKRVKVPYEDTLWDTTYEYLGKWEVFLPPNTDIFFANTFGKPPTFDVRGPTDGIMIFLSPANVDDSLRFKYGDGFLTNPFYRKEVCKNFRYGRINLYVVDKGIYEEGGSSYSEMAVEKFSGVGMGCFSVRLRPGPYAFILKNAGNDAENVVVRILNLRLHPTVVKRYRVIEVPTR